MVDNPNPYGARHNRRIGDNFTQYGNPYRTTSNDSNFDYYRSSSSSSSSGSGKILVHRPYTSTSRSNPIFNDELTSPNVASLTSEPDQTVGKFCIGGYLRPPSTSENTASAFYPPAPVNPSLLTVPEFGGWQQPTSKLSQNILYDTRAENSGSKPTGIASLPETFWQIPRANLWCSHSDCAKEGSKCSACQLKEETTSNCSSENPPPTFTALDNIHPIKIRKKWCKCAITCLTTTTVCLLVLSLIGAYILYVEVVLKRNEYVPDPM